MLDGHIVLSRDLAAGAHWPPIDVLQSLSRLQPHLVAPHDLKVAAAARQHLAEYRRHADLISIGAYRQGSDPKVDAAIAMRDPLNMFLQQEASQITPLPDSNRMLAQLIGTQAVNSSVNGGVSAQAAGVDSMVDSSPGVVTT